MGLSKEHGLTLGLGPVPQWLGGRIKIPRKRSRERERGSEGKNRGRKREWERKGEILYSSKLARPRNIDLDLFAMKVRTSHIKSVTVCLGQVDIYFSNLQKACVILMFRVHSETRLPEIKRGLNPKFPKVSKICFLTKNHKWAVFIVSEITGCKYGT